MIEDNSRLAFLEALKKLVEKARAAGGVLSSQELEEALAPFALGEAEKKNVEAYLKGENIGIDDALPVEEVLTEEEHRYLTDYEELVRSLEVPAGGAMDALFLQAMAGERDAQQRLAQALLPLVLDLSKLYAGQGVFLEDLIGAGNEALVRGTRLLAPLEGPGEVEGFLTKQVMNAMEDLIAENLDQKSRDADAIALANRVMEAADALAEELGHPVSAEELAAQGEITLEEILDAVRITHGAIESLAEAGEAGGE